MASKFGEDEILKLIKDCEKLGISSKDEMHRQVREQSDSFIVSLCEKQAAAKKSGARIAALKVKVQEGKHEIQKLERELADIQQVNAELEYQNKNLEEECMKQHNALSKNEEQMLGISAKEYASLKQMTGIHWDFDCDPSMTQGYITNRTNNYIHAFSFEGDGASDSLWEEIGKAATHDWSDIQEPSASNV